MKLVWDTVGKTIWSRFFGNQNITTEHYVPLQLHAVLTASLQKAEAVMKDYCEEFDLKDGAKAKFGVLQEDDLKAKKARTGPYQR